MSVRSRPVTAAPSLHSQLQDRLTRKSQTPRGLVQHVLQGNKVLGRSPRATTFALPGVTSMCVKIPNALLEAKQLKLPKTLTENTDPDASRLLTNPRLGMPFATLGPVVFMRRIMGQRVSQPDEVGPPAQLTLDYFDIVEGCEKEKRSPSQAEIQTILRYNDLLKAGHTARSRLHGKLAGVPLPHYVDALRAAQQVAQNKHMLDFTHGGNILYDPKTKQFGFVDIQRPGDLRADEKHCLKYFSPEGFLGALIQGSGTFGMPAPKLGLRYLALPPLTGNPKVDAQKRGWAERIMGNVLTAKQNIIGPEKPKPPHTTVPEELQRQIRETLDAARRTRPQMVSARDLPDTTNAWGALKV